MKKNLLIVLSLLIVFIVSTAGILTDSGRSGKAGSPSESTCVQCHSDNPINSQGGSVTISSNMSNWQYQPGQTYSMTVTISETGKTVFGLCFESLKNSDNTNAGTFAITHATESQTMTASNGRACVTHKLDGGFVTTPGTKAFAFNWTAPATNVGNLTFYVATIAGDHDGSEAGDNVYTTTHVVTPVSVDMDEYAATLQFNVAPNPVNDVLNIFVDNVNARTVSADLYSITGAKVSTLFSDAVSGASIEKHISVSSFSAGIYFVKIYAGNKSIMKRLVIE